MPDAKNAPPDREQANPSAYDLFIAVMAVVSMAVVVWRLLLPDGQELAKLLDKFDLVFCLVFFIDYIRNIIISPRRMRYIFTWGLFDLASSVPAWGPLRLARIAQLVRILRALRSIRILVRVMRRDRAATAVAMTMLTTIVVVIAICIAVLDAERNAPGATIKTAEDVAWWAVVTTSTVGYGDFTPVTQTGRVLAVVLMVVGIGLFATVAGALAGLLLRRPDEAVKEELDDAELRLERIEQQNLEVLKRLEDLSSRIPPG